MFHFVVSVCLASVNSKSFAHNCQMQNVNKYFPNWKLQGSTRAFGKKRHWYKQIHTHTRMGREKERDRASLWFSHYIQKDQCTFFPIHALFHHCLSFSVKQQTNFIGKQMLALLPKLVFAGSLIYDIFSGVHSFIVVFITFSIEILQTKWWGKKRTFNWQINWKLIKTKTEEKKEWKEQ